LGFNAVRLPFCPATLDNAPVSSIDYSKNSDLQGLGSLEVLDRVIAELDKNGIYILLDHHRPDCNAISELWYTSEYSEQDWIGDLIFLADRYSDKPSFIGIDLKNEPHGAATWGTGNPDTDWDQAAARAAQAVLAADPDILVFAEGIQENPVCSSESNHWWGGNLEPQNCAQLDIPENKLVFSPHVYGPDVYAQPYFSDPSFPSNMPPIWDQHFGYLTNEGRVIVPGELGGRYGHGGDPDDVAWQDALIDYFADRQICNFFYWSWNPNSGDTGGILQDDWSSVWQDKVDNLQRLVSACGGETVAACDDGLDNDDDGLVDLDDPGCASAVDNDETDPVTPSYQCSDGQDNDGDGLVDLADPGCTTADDDSEQDPTGPGGIQVDLLTQSDWGTGYCATLVIRNTSATAIDWTATVPIEGHTTTTWNAIVGEHDGVLDLEGLSWNNLVPAGGSIDSVGFCAER